MTTTAAKHATRNNLKGLNKTQRRELQWQQQAANMDKARLKKAAKAKRDADRIAHLLANPKP